MTPLELHAAAWKRIKDKKHWTQGYYARDSAKFTVSPNSPNAVCWCSVGALQKEAIVNDVIMQEVSEALNQASIEAGFSNIATANDTLPHPKVMAIWKRAGEILKGCKA
jgi:hypothetical protein